MANPYVNKVEYGGQTLIDLTNDTATEEDVLSGKTFHDKSGALRTGNLSLAEVAYSGEFGDLKHRPTFTVSNETLIFGSTSQ